MYTGNSPLVASDFFEKLFSLYRNVHIPKDYENLGKIDSKLFWYYADEKDRITHIITEKSRTLIELDINSAFLTICNNLFPNTEFVDHLNEIKHDKMQRNIFIATQLKDTTYLERLNWICKMIIFGLIISIDKKIQIYEIKKDGIICFVPNDDLLLLEDLSQINNEFIKFITDSGFTFSITKLNKYVRAYKTTYTLSDDILKIKGVYKYPPEYLYNLLLKILNETITEKEKMDILKIYSMKYFDVLRNLKLRDLIIKYFRCSNNKYISKKGYTENLKDIFPEGYRNFLINPVLLCALNV